MLTCSVWFVQSYPKQNGAVDHATTEINHNWDLIMQLVDHTQESTFAILLLGRRLMLMGQVKLLAKRLRSYARSVWLRVQVDTYDSPRLYGISVMPFYPHASL